MKRLHIAITSAVFMLFIFMTACFPVVSRFNKWLETDPITLLDEVTGEGIDKALVLPLYFSGSGVTTGAGHGPSSASPGSAYMANPLIYFKDKSCEPKKPLSVGIVFGPAWLIIGSFQFLQGALVVAPHHQARWINNLYAGSNIYKLKPLTLEQSREQNLQLLKELDKDIITTDIASFWEGNRKLDIEVRLKRKEKKEIQAFLGESIE